MAKHDDPGATYPCMMRPEHLRRVDHPHDERLASTRGRVRRALTKLAARARA